MLRRCRGTINWQRLADRRRWRLETSHVRLQQSTRYWGALFCRHWWTMTPSLYWIRWGMSNQCNSKWSSLDKPQTSAFACGQLARTTDHSGCRVKHTLNPVCDCPWWPSQQGIAVVNSRRNESVYKSRCGGSLIRQLVRLYVIRVTIQVTESLFLSSSRKCALSWTPSTSLAPPSAIRVVSAKKVMFSSALAS